MVTAPLDQDAAPGLAAAVEHLPLTGELPEVLAAAARQFCLLLRVRRCLLFLRDQGTGHYRGHAALSAEGVLAIDDVVLAADFAEQLEAARRPLEIRDARGEACPVSSRSREFELHSLLGVPLALGEELEGLVILDDLERRRAYPEAEQQLALAFARVVTPIIAAARVTAALREKLLDSERRNRLLSHAAAADERLSTFALGADVRKIVAAVAKITRRRCSLYDARFELRAESSAADTTAILAEPSRSRSGVEEQLRAMSGKRSAIVGPFPALGTDERWLIAPVGPPDRPTAYLVVDESGNRLRAADQLIVGRAVTSVALALAGQSQAAAEAGDAREVLAGELIRGRRDPESLRALARAAEMDLTAEHVVALVTERAPDVEPLPSPRNAARILQRCLAGQGPILATGVTEGIALVVPLRVGAVRHDALSKLVDAFHAWCDSVSPTGALVVVISTGCRGPEGYSRAIAEAQDAAGAIAELAHGTGHTVTAVDDLGLARMFLLRPDAVFSRRFLSDTLGPLLEPTDARHGELLETLRAFLRAGHSIRACAREMFVHENTVRYRLSRVQELLGVDVVGDPQAQLTLQMAMTVLALSGRAAAVPAALEEPEVALDEA